ncbi:phage major tail tube protein [uncultured Megasphaera sp.]|uniref:phage major tail tube protein n=1 Tax=uncultured Megasphaera sp. TaxID=165188 RepID=UPI00266B4D53|nr:phage major tail tube protein [uncultured Megasphaera sp.]
MPELPSLLVNFRVYDGSSNDMIGVADVELPKLEAMTESLKGAGVAGEIDMPVLGHYSSMETKLNFRTVDKNAITISAAKSQKLDIRGAQEVYDKASGEIKVVSVKLVVKGIPKSTELGKFEMGAGTDSSLTLETIYLKLTIDGKTKAEIDKLNYITNIDGTDFSADIRSALGL